MRLRRVAEPLGMFGLFAALTVVMTWPQALHLSSHAPQHQDVYFNMWRLRWFAHAMTSSATLFDANIFFPERRTLALSDAMLVEGAVALPFGWMPPVLLHNLMILGAMAASAAAMFALVRYLTGSRGAGLLAGVVFAFGPYRFEHLMHMELQWAMWSPLAFLALHRAYDSGRWRDGLAAGAFVALQMLSSIYYGIFLATLIGIGGLLLFPRDRRAPARRVATVVAAGVGLAAVVSFLYATPYLRTQHRVGDRSPGEIAELSARPADYLAPASGNWVYGATFVRTQERRLFPGLTPVLLALVALLLRAPSRRVIVYSILLAVAFEMSLGFNGYSYSFLYEHLSAYRGLRAPSRLGIFVLLFVGVLVGFGYTAATASRGIKWRSVTLAACLAMMLIEYRTRIALVEFPNRAPALYDILRKQPRGVVAEFPVPRGDRLPGLDPAYSYMSTFHWFPTVNGYSGVYPRSYLDRLDRLEGFPDEKALMQLKRDGVQYVILHNAAYEPDVALRLQTQIELGGSLVALGEFDSINGRAVLYRMR